MAAGTDYYTSFSKSYFRLISPKWHVLSDHSTFVSETVLFLKDLYNFHLKQQALVFTLSSSPNCLSFLWHLVQNPIKLVHKQMPFFSINLAKDSLMTHCNTFLGIQEYQTSLSGEGNGNPLQYSCLENPMDKGAWWATVQGVAKSQT